MVRKDTRLREISCLCVLTEPIHRLDIQLNVKGIKTLYDAFRDYIAVETLDGELRYHAEGFGLQEARKGIIFQSLPPVLHLLLKRYEYDVQSGAMVKVRVTCVLGSYRFGPDPPWRSTIASSSPSKLTSSASSTRLLTGPNPGSTGFTVSLYTPVISTVDIISLSSNRIAIPSGSNLTTSG